MGAPFCPKLISPNQGANMRKQFVEAKTRKQAADACPWASEIIKVDGGYMCFESVEDARIWRAQK